MLQDNQFTTEFINKLLKDGLTRQQATSKTAQVVFDELIGMDDAALKAEIRSQLETMLQEMMHRDYVLSQWKKKAYDAAYAYEEWIAAAKDNAKKVAAGSQIILDTERKYKAEMSDKAKDVAMLYSTLLNIALVCGKDTDAIDYILFAYCGGQTVYIPTQADGDKDCGSDDWDD